MVFGCKIKGIKTTAVVTDLPDMSNSGSLLKRINNSIFGMTDSFILLTEQMNGRVNKKNKPFIVLEGHVDSEAPVPEDQLQYKDDNLLRTVTDSVGSRQKRRNKPRRTKTGKMIESSQLSGLEAVNDFL